MHVELSAVADPVDEARQLLDVADDYAPAPGIRWTRTPVGR
ncbi:hypothetical protein ACIGXA_10605 [Streptomyces fildesensis]|uniref:Uncharacterized protein n=1 Tax=Streptomyces fildesensis TaxID=375757 RepID=A0ABW8C4E3_9ACTN